MKINTISNQIYINNKKTNFGAKKDKKTVIQQSQTPSLPSGKLVPAMMALAGMTVLGSCSEAEQKYNAMSKFEKECLAEFPNVEDELPRVGKDVFIFKSIKDSVVKETKDYKYSHVSYINDKSIHVFGEITRKADNKTMKFINEYDKDYNLTSTTLKDTKNGDKFYVQYENGSVKDVLDEKGESIKGQKRRFIISFLVIAAICGAGLVFNDKKPD